MSDKIDILVPDSTVIVESLVSTKLISGEISPNKIIIHEALISVFEHLAYTNQTLGFLGLEELQRIKELSGDYELKFAGMKPHIRDKDRMNLVNADGLARELAYDESGILMTSDKIRAKIAKAKGVELLFFDITKNSKDLKIDKYFDEFTMSAHLRENIIPYVKKGRPGGWTSESIGKDILQRDDIISIARELTEEASRRKDGFIEIQREGSTIIQLGKYRIVVTRPPFSDGWEITAVRPVKKLSLSDYKLSEKLMDRIEKHAEGILVAGAPGMGKSTFAQGLAEFYAASSKTVKTVEAPRDLLLSENITQYAISHGSSEEVHDVLLLTRPDYTVFDEMRNTDDFNLFADMRLSGVGMIGIVHATTAVDSIQRFMNRVELGVIPQIIDTVVFIKNGEPQKVLNLAMTVKVPSGMMEADLARPVVEVKDFETGNLDYEIYTYGEQTVVMPVDEEMMSGGSGANLSPARNLAKKAIEDEIQKINSSAQVEMLSEHRCRVFMPEKDISKVIGRQGKNIEKLEKQIGISIDVEPLDEKRAAQSQAKSQSSPQGKFLDYDVQITKKAIEFHVGAKNKNKEIDVVLDDEYLLSAKVGSSGIVKIHKKNKFGKIIEKAYNKREKIAIILS